MQMIPTLICFGCLWLRARSAFPQKCYYCSTDRTLPDQLCPQTGSTESDAKTDRVKLKQCDKVEEGCMSYIRQDAATGTQKMTAIFDCARGKDFCNRVTVDKQTYGEVVLGSCKICGMDGADGCNAPQPALFEPYTAKLGNQTETPNAAGSAVPSVDGILANFASSSLFLTLILYSAVTSCMHVGFE